ncbi:hypothetical protein SODALDRAFT_94255 [Sodiomyces alkalinus F11]|uniref:Glutamic acid-rich protein n=1 Tax=Sodiomyces alkalinus (strain CBS 110278 / VKM F-3762 / F11) TaxID=1314773 RepID=A0A3N2Q0S3_SODAK|nr:hypothetical protein SODALDRAFT_94255 [Sodiomyces alkalinus F11]ROT40342.1 hypothetical protein SODALDRAFT_94255 [Sodiomyces alkalinus F11]
MSTTLQVPDGDMSLDLSAPVDGLESHMDDGYIDYSEDEAPESSPIKAASNISSFDANLSAGDAPNFAEQAPGAIFQSTTVIATSEFEVADSTVEPPMNGDAVLAETSALVDDASVPAPSVIEPKREHSQEPVITWDEEQLKSVGPEEEMNVAQNSHPDNEQSESEAPKQPSADSETVDDTYEDDGAGHLSPNDLVDEETQDPESVADASATVLSSQQGDDSQHEIDYEEAAPDHTESEKKQEHDDGLGEVNQLGEDHGSIPDTGDDGGMPVENASDSEGREYGDESMQDFDGTGDGLEIYPAEDQDDDADIQYGESSTGSLHTPEDGEVDMPMITVSWRGADYPLFYHSPGSEGRECFFDDLSLLQCKMEELIASFRRELGNDLSDVDELVFQVDELGLEFAETCRPDEFSEITLGGILQIFDTLVKNKDPEASRPMYCYLLTRPRTAKRWHALIEDAYQGKNIDEVCCSFQPQGHDSGDADSSDEDPGMALMQVDDEIGDDVEDEVEGEVEVVVEGVEDEAEQLDGDDGEVDPSYTLDHGLEQEFDDARSSKGDEVVDEDLEAVGAAETGASEPTDDDVHAATSMPDELASSQAPEANTAEGPLDESREVVELASAYDVSETAHFLNPTDMQTDDVAYDREQQVVSGDDEDTTTVEAVAAGLDNDAASRVSPVSSATATLNGDDEEDFGAGIDLNADLSRDDFHDHPSPSTRETRHDELEEIDWRDYPGQGDDEETLHDTASVTGKRPRSEEDDTLGEEDEQDVKRQRS